MSTQIDSAAPDFSLPDLAGQVHRLSDWRGKIVILNFWSCECPHAARTDAVIVGMLPGWRDDVQLLAIASNRNESLAALNQAAGERALPRVLYDVSGAVADLYEAQTTPHIFVIDRDGILRYRGAVDDVTFRRRIATQNFLDLVVGALLDGARPPLTETPAYGCAIVREV